MKGLLIFAICVFLSACASPGIEKYLEDGGTIVEGGVSSLIGENGITLVAVEGDWTAYLGPNGRKVSVITHLKKTVEQSWRFDEQGVFCEMMQRPERELCDWEGRVLLKNKNDVYSYFVDGKKGEYPFKALEGNVNNF